MRVSGLLSTCKILFFLLSINLLILLPYAISISEKGLYIDKLMVFFALTMSSVAVLSRIVYALISIPVIFINVVFLHLEYRWGLRWLGARIETALEAPFFEIISYLKSYFGRLEVVILLYAILSIVLVVYLLRKVKYSKKWYYLSFIGIALTLIVAVARYDKITNLAPVKIVTSLISTQDRIENFKTRDKYLAEYNYSTENCSVEYDNVVIVIGESATKHRMSSYGYGKVTTPFLDSSSPFLLQAISPANLTRISVPIMLTSASVRNFSSFFKSISIVSRLRECGYETFWMSSQAEMGSNETYIASIANEANHVYYLNKKFQSPDYDEGLIDELDRMKITEGKRKAFFFHLNGSHFDYSDRYPQSLVPFDSNSIESRYDNSIYYTDMLLSKIYSRFDKNNLLFIYISDHGEVVDNKIYGHGFSPAYKDEFDIPLAVWTMKPDVMDEFLRNSDFPINTESFNYFVEYLVGIRNTSPTSYNPKVISVKDDNLVDYFMLKTFSETNSSHNFVGR